MRHAFNSLLFILCLIAFTRCNDDSENPISILKEDNLVKVTMRSTQALDYSLGSFGDEEGASITQQAASFKSSFLERKNYTEVIYHYTPEKNFTGTVSVELKSGKKWNFETKRHDEETLITVEITVIEELH